MWNIFVVGWYLCFRIFERDWWRRPSDFLVMVLVYMNMSRFFFEWGWGLGERFYFKLIIYWWVLVRKQTDSDNDDVSWWSSYLSWFYPSFAVLMTYDYDLALPAAHSLSTGSRTGSKHEWNCSLPQSGVPRWRASSQTVTNPYNLCQ